MLRSAIAAVLLMLCLGLNGCATPRQQADAVEDDTTDTTATPESNSAARSDRPIGATGSVSTGIATLGQAGAGSETGPLDVTSEEYRIGPQDLINVRVFGVEALSGDLRVNSSGDVSIPLIGTIRAAGMTPIELEDRLEALLAINYLQDPQVTVFVKEFGSQRITLEGAISKPGVYALSTRTTLLQAIALAGGLARLADSEAIRLIRPNEQGDGFETLIYDLDEIRNGEADDPVLAAGDKIVVNRSDARVMLNDSLFRDTIDLLNPFRFVVP